MEFFNISRYLLYITIFLYIAILYDRSLYLYYCIAKITRINGENDNLTETNKL